MTKNETIKAIAKTHLELNTLETRKSDSLDFSDQAVWSIKEALEAAYEAGRKAGPEKDTTPKGEFLAAVTKAAKEYAEEAEHQDGPEYWKSFENFKQAMKDFALFVECGND